VGEVRTNSYMAFRTSLEGEGKAMSSYLVVSVSWRGGKFGGLGEVVVS
jgi:hypothetical protein